MVFAVFKVTSKLQLLREHRNPEISRMHSSEGTHRKHPDTGIANHSELSAPGAQFEKPRFIHLTKYSTNHNYREFK